jgi:hypothetical protein
VRLHEQRVEQHPQPARVTPVPFAAPQAAHVLAFFWQGQVLSKEEKIMICILFVCVKN